MAALLGLWACADRAPATQTRFLMGTVVEIAAYPDSPATRQAVDAAFRRMEEVEAAAHGSEVLETLRRGEPSEVGEDLARILETSRRVREASRGAFDPALGELTRLWGFGEDRPRLPPDDLIRSALARRWTVLPPVRDGRVDPDRRPLDLDLGGVAKGYAVDEAIRTLASAGVPSAIVNAGGDLAVLGRRPGRDAWRVGIQEPDDPQGLLGVLDVRGGAVVTSGDYERFFLLDGVRYHHILDPGTGRPARSGLRSVTVAAGDCAEADALATAVFVLGPERGLELLRGWPGSEGVLVTEGGDVLTTEGIGPRLPFERR